MTKTYILAKQIVLKIAYSWLAFVFYGIFLSNKWWWRWIWIYCNVSTWQFHITNEKRIMPIWVFQDSDLWKTINSETRNIDYYVKSAQFSTVHPKANSQQVYTIVTPRLALNSLFVVHCAKRWSCKCCLKMLNWRWEKFLETRASTVPCVSNWLLACLASTIWTWSLTEVTLICCHFQL